MLLTVKTPLWIDLLYYMPLTLIFYLKIYTTNNNKNKSGRISLWCLRCGGAMLNLGIEVPNFGATYLD